MNLDIYTEFYSGADFSFLKAVESARTNFEIAANWMLIDRGMMLHSWQMSSIAENGIYQAIIVAAYVKDKSEAAQ